MPREVDRFVRTYKQGTFSPFEIWVDRETGVNYLVMYSGHGSSMTPLLDENGNPIITDPYDLDRYR